MLYHVHGTVKEFDCSLSLWLWNCNKEEDANEIKDFDFC